MNQDVVVLGAGLMGRLLALSLARQGARVQLHDAHGPDALHSAARAAAAMLAPLAESAITELPVVRMGQHALARWPELLATLPAPVYFQQAGTLILWHRQDQAEAQRFEALVRRTHAQLPELPAPETLHRERLAALEPAVAGRFTQGLYLPGEGQLDNRQLLDALHLALQEAGVQLHWHAPVLARDAAELRSAFPQAGQIVDCRGLGAQPAWPALRGVRGEVVRLHAPGVQLQRPTRLMHPRYPIYIAPKQDGVFMIGATEIETEDLSPASVRSTLELLSAAYSVDSGFAEARILEITAQARPTLPDNLPRLRTLGPGVLQVNGLYRHGYLIAPAVHDAALQWLTQGESPLARQWGLL
ncbi:MAG: FAD-dependent oxidoreductase [Betaproteobacteria bacterium]|nr:FAD-dependent oxidoreductase [Betaproteobacteria bacterium]